MKVICKFITMLVFLGSTLNANATGPNFSPEPSIKNQSTCTIWAKEQKDVAADFPIVTEKGDYVDHIPLEYIINQCLGKDNNDITLLGSSVGADEAACSRFPNIKYCVEMKTPKSLKWPGNRGGF